MFFIHRVLARSLTLWYRLPLGHVLLIVVKSLSVVSPALVDVVLLLFKPSEEQKSISVRAVDFKYLCTVFSKGC